MAQVAAAMSSCTQVATMLNQGLCLGARPARTQNAVPMRKTRLMVTAEQDMSSTEGMQLSRRAMAASLVSVASAAALLVNPSPAAAESFEEKYTRETLDIINSVRSTLSLSRDDPEKGGAVAKLRTTSNDWVARYRREKAVAGKPSFSAMYSVVNAISGHYISFGPSYPIPAKRQARILEEMTDAERALGRGR